MLFFINGFAIGGIVLGILSAMAVAYFSIDLYPSIVCW